MYGDVHIVQQRKYKGRSTLFLYNIFKRRSTDS